MKKNLLFALLILGFAVPSAARDFTYTYEGQTLTYTVIDEAAKTCETKAGSDNNGMVTPGNKISGNLIIPSTVVNSSKQEYKVVKIGDYSFAKSVMKTVQIPNSVTSLGDACFEGCSGLTSFTIPNSVTSIGEGILACTNNLEKIVVATNNEKYCHTYDGVLYSKDKTTIIQCPGGKTGWFFIPKTVTSINGACFKGCNGLESINIPNSVTSLGRDCFQCDGLTRVYYNTYEPISEDRYAIFSQKVYSSATLYMPKRGLEVAKTTSPWKNFNKTQDDGFEFSIGDFEFKVLDEDAKTCKVRDFNSNIFGHIDIPEYANGYKVVELGPYSFFDCNIYTITIPNSVERLGTFCFDACDNLTSVVLPNSVTFLGCGGFSRCPSLQSVVLPPSITIEKISGAQYAPFYQCTGLKKCAYPSTIANPFPSGNAHIIRYDPNEATVEDGFVYGKSKTTLLFAPLTLKGDFSVPNSVTSIGDYCFYGCTALTSIILPGTVKKIGNYAFDNCKLDPLILKGDIEKNNYAFRNLNSNSHIFCQLESYSTINSMASCKVCSYPFKITCDGYFYGGAKFSIEPTAELAEEKYADYFNFTKNTVYHFSCNGEEFRPENGCMDYFVKGLQPSTKYYYTLKYQNLNSFNGEYSSYFTTREPSLSYNYSSSTQTVIKDFYPVCPSDESVTPTNITYTIDGKTYDYTGKTRNIGSLTPDTKYPFTIKADYNGKIITYSSSIKTKSVISGEEIQLGPTSADLNVNIDAGNAKITEMFWNFDGNKLESKKPIITGLRPNATYSFGLTLKYDNGGSNQYTYTKTTPQLQLDILDPKCTTSTSAILGALTNMSDYETNAGFQWKKYDAPESLKPSEAYTPVSGGMMEGIVKNLQSTSYYKVRAFYKSASGTYYYSDWLTFDPSDFSYFEPTVRTYAITQVNGNSVTLQGYALQGTDDIISQGFEYEMTGSGASHIRTLAATSGTIIAKGQVMTATLTDLPDGQYTFKAFVQTSASYTYGEPQTFTIDYAGVSDITVDQAEPEIVGYYDLNGRKYAAPQHGFNIVIYSDGSTKKLMVQ